ncbi:MAG: hypothetical protein WCH43_01035 [Verrucomicrobiota bacterium]
MNSSDLSYDFFEPGDLTALICIDDPKLQELVVEELSVLNYKLHIGLFAEDISLKLRTHTYNVVLIYENFGGNTLKSNPILSECIQIPSMERRKQFLLLVGPSMITNDNMQAFKFSVDMVCNETDLQNLMPILNRGLVKHEEAYQAFNECMRMIGASVR